MAARAQILAARTQEELQAVARECEVSREKRRVDYTTLRAWYDFGTATGIPATNNKLRSHLDRLASYLWSPDMVRFGVHLPPAARPLWMSASGTARDEFRQTWANSGADAAVSLALEWSLVYGGLPLKIRPDPTRGFALDTIDPWDFGVSREDQDLDDQDAMVHWYALSFAQFQRWIWKHPREAELLRAAESRKRVPAGGAGSGAMIPTAVSGTFPSSNVSTVNTADGADPAYLQDAMVREEILLLADVWQRTVYRDSTHGEFEDWRVVTAWADDYAPLLTRRNPILGWQASPSGPLPAENPFTMLVPRPVPSFVWGRSELLNLMNLQSWREKQIEQMREVITRQLNPARLYVGIPDPSEAGTAMATPGGYYGTPDPGGKMELIQVQVGQEAFGMLATIDRSFEDASGIPPLIAQGEQPGGVRANSQLMSLAGIGAGRIRHMALQLESALSRVATLAFRILQRNDSQAYTTPKGERFLLIQLPAGTVLQVSAHSASPIFAEQTQAKALELLKAGAIDGEMLAELLDPPHRDEIKELARTLAQSKAQMQERMIELELARLRKRGGGLK
jgi:hypothetical protein